MRDSIRLRRKSRVEIGRQSRELECLLPVMIVRHVFLWSLLTLQSGEAVRLTPTARLTLFANRGLPRSGSEARAQALAGIAAARGIERVVEALSLPQLIAPINSTAQGLFSKYCHTPATFLRRRLVSLAQRDGLDCRCRFLICPNKTRCALRRSDTARFPAPQRHICK